MTADNCSLNYDKHFKDRDIERSTLAEFNSKRLE